jgi:RHS repeat-associated protein
MAVEYSTVAATPGTAYMFTDMLGSIRTITDQSGNVIENYDYLPFGRMLSSSQNGRANLNFPDYPDVPTTNPTSRTPQKFTGKERDAETGLDFFLARYYSGAQGRFISPDPMLGSANIFNPQTWNRYEYVLNNPLKLIDPYGLFVWDISLGGGKKDEDLMAEYELGSDDQKAEIIQIISFRNRFRTFLKRDSYAAAQFGPENVDNGVTVAIGAILNPAATGYPHIYQNLATGNFSYKVIVTFNPNSSDNDFLVGGSHEPVHIYTIQCYVLFKNGIFFYADYANRTKLDDEEDAYNRTVRIVKDKLYYSDFLLISPPNTNHPENEVKYEIWNRGMEKIDRELLRMYMNDRGQSPDQKVFK